LQLCGEVPVDLDGIERAVAAFQQLGGERTAPRADLHQVIAGAYRQRLCDARDHCRIVQEMLTEAPAARWPGGSRWRHQ
jgi:hypothetical protein